MKVKKHEVHVHHVEPVKHRGAANHRQVKEDPTKTLGRIVTSEPSEPSMNPQEMEAAKMALFQRGGSGNSDAVPHPTTAPRDWNDDDLSEINDEGH